MCGGINGLCWSVSRSSWLQILYWTKVYCIFFSDSLRSLGEGTTEYTFRPHQTVPGPFNTNGDLPRIIKYRRVFTFITLQNTVDLPSLTLPIVVECRRCWKSDTSGFVIVKWKSRLEGSRRVIPNCLVVSVRFSINRPVRSHLIEGNWSISHSLRSFVQKVQKLSRAHRLARLAALKNCAFFR